MHACMRYVHIFFVHVNIGWFVGIAVPPHHLRHKVEPSVLFASLIGPTWFCQWVVAFFSVLHIIIRILVTEILIKMDQKRIWIN